MRGKEDPAVLFHAPLKGMPIVKIRDDCFGSGYSACAGVHSFHFSSCVHIKGEEPGFFRVGPDPVDPEAVLIDMEEHFTLCGISVRYFGFMQDIGGIRRDALYAELIHAFRYSPCPLTLLISV